MASKPARPPSNSRAIRPKPPGIASRCARSERLQASSKQPLCSRDSRPRSNGPTVRMLTAFGFALGRHVSAGPPPVMLPRSCVRPAGADRRAGAPCPATAAAAASRRRAAAQDTGHRGPASTTPIAGCDTARQGRAARRPAGRASRTQLSASSPPAPEPARSSGCRSAEKRCAYNSSRRASMTTWIGRGRPGAGRRAASASVSSVPTPSSGRSSARARARATAMPARRPVKLPGPASRRPARGRATPSRPRPGPRRSSGSSRSA